MARGALCVLSRMPLAPQGLHIIQKRYVSNTAEIWQVFGKKTSAGWLIEKPLLFLVSFWNLDLLSK